MTNDLPPLDDDYESQDTTPHDAERTQAYTPPQDESTRPYTPNTAPTRPQVAHDTAHVQPLKNEDRTQNQRRVNTQQRSASTKRAASPRSGTQRRMPMSQNTPVRRRSNALYLPWWSLVLMLIVVLLASFLVVGGVYMLGGSTITSVTQAPIVRIITAEPTLANSGLNLPQPTQDLVPSTQVISGGNNTTTLELTGPTLAPVELTPTPQPLTVGSAVQVSGVGDQELNVRDVAGIVGTNIVFRADEGERFVIISGPTQADGFTWWQIQDTTNATRTGWAVSNYLSISADGS